MNDIFDVLEICLQELENGADMESVLARYPQLAAELRPILNASVLARMRSMSAPAPSLEAVRRGRAKVLQQAAQMREIKVAPRGKRMIPVFQRLAIAFTLTALFLTSGTGLVNASSSALPGENLYPVKLTWESVRLFLALDEKHREALEYSFENERLHEVNELLVEGRHETIRFAGVYMEVNGITYVAGFHIVVLNTSILPAQPLSNGMAVVVTGHTNAEGFVDVKSIELLPPGSVVPEGKPVEVEADHNGNDNHNANENENDDVNDNGDSGDDNNVNINDNGNDSNKNDNVNADENENNVENINSNDSINDNNTNESNTNDENNNNNDSDGGDDNSGSGGDDNSGSGGGGGDDGGGDDGGGDD